MRNIIPCHGKLADWVKCLYVSNIYNADNTDCTLRVQFYFLLIYREYLFNVLLRYCRR